MSKKLACCVGFNVVSLCINYITNDTNGIIANGLLALIFLKMFELDD